MDIRQITHHKLVTKFQKLNTLYLKGPFKTVIPHVGELTQHQYFYQLAKKDSKKTLPKIEYEIDISMLCQKGNAIKFSTTYIEYRELLIVSYYEVLT